MSLLGSEDVAKLSGFIPNEGNHVDGDKELAQAAYTRVKILKELGADGADDVRQSYASVVLEDQKYHVFAAEILGGKGGDDDDTVKEIRKKYGRTLKGIHDLAGALRSVAVQKQTEKNLSEALNKANNKWNIDEIGNPMKKVVFK